MGVLCGQGSGFEILLGEGVDVELGVRTSKQILLFALDSLTLTLSLFILCHCIISYCSFILYAWLGGVCLTCA